MRIFFSYRHVILQSTLLAILGTVFTITLLLPLFNSSSWLGQSQPQLLRSADNPAATLTNHGMLYRSDSRGLYLLVRSQWQLQKPLQEGDALLVELLNEKSKTISHSKQDVEKYLICNDSFCTLDMTSTLRAPDDALANSYQVRIGIQLKDGAESNQFSQLLALPEKGFNVASLLVNLTMVLALSAIVMKAVMPILRRNIRWRILGSLLLGNLTFVLLHGFVVFKLGEFLLWSGFRPAQYYFAWGSIVLGWSLCALAGFNLYMGLVFTALFGIGLLANFMKISIYGVPLGGDDLDNLAALFRILLDQHPIAPLLGTVVFLLLCWRFALSRWVLRAITSTAAFFALCVFATQTSNKLLGSNIRYVDRTVNYHRDIIRSGPGIYILSLVDELLQSGNVLRYPLPLNERTPLRNRPHLGTTPRWDLVIVMQYESLWFDWKGGICAPIPTLHLPASIQQWHKTIHSPTTGGMTVLAEFEMNTGLPAGLLKQGIVPYYYFSEEVPGLARSAGQSGYQTLFAHPYVETFWGRAKAIPALGYQERWFDNRFTPLEHKGRYISDDALITHLLKRVEQDEKPLFAYAVTMQGHGPFDGPRYNSKELDGSCPNESDRQLLNTYYTGVVDAMASLERLLKSLDHSGKRYLVVAFGDHQPFLMSAGEAIHGDKPPRDATYQIPMMAFTRADDSLDLATQFAPVRQLYQMGQATRQLLAGDLNPISDSPLIHPVLGEEQGFDVSQFIPQIRATFKTNAQR
ncbi:sulfatase [Aeromonas veronii]|uniref:LTA synthase family protein n=1 Tax=Aeromonas veronii TaxID=654 RepID=UPI000946E004|nr:alkaline phosphatase family protein [Aeromonas veronii]OLF57799.1 sulfatase [Aeromonas veronii]